MPKIHIGEKCRIKLTYSEPDLCMVCRSILHIVYVARIRVFRLIERDTFWKKNFIVLLRDWSALLLIDLGKDVSLSRRQNQLIPQSRQLHHIAVGHQLGRHLNISLIGCGHAMQHHSDLVREIKWVRFCFLDSKDGLLLHLHQVLVAVHSVALLLVLVQLSGHFRKIEQIDCWQV